MDEVITKLIEIDKNARKKVRNAKQTPERISELLAQKRSSLEEANEAIQKLTLENLRLERAEILEKRSKELEAQTSAALETIERKKNENFETWVSEITGKVCT